MGTRCYAVASRTAALLRTAAVLLAAGLALAVLLGGCGGGHHAATTDPDLVISPLARDTTPDATAAEVQALVSGNTDFGLALFKRGAATADTPNFFVSPYSVSLAFSMLSVGARGDTASQLASAFGFSLSAARHHVAFDALDLTLASRDGGEPLPPAGTKPEGFHLQIANAFFGQRDFSFQQPFLDTLALSYGAGLRVLDFGSDPEAARETINGWVSEKTNETIKDLLPAGSLNTATRFVLANAIYFLAAWQEQFDPEATGSADFHTADGRTVAVDMMHQRTPLSYAAGGDYQAVDLGYLGNAMSMLVLLPGEGQFSSFAAGLDSSRLAAIVGALSSQEVILSLPKFKIESPLSLREPLEAMGVTDAFDPAAADFSGLDGAKDIFVAVALHKAFVSVDEAGTEAGAATAIGGATSAPGDPPQMTVDRPFLFLIRDRATGAVLFIGQVTDASA